MTYQTPCRTAPDDWFISRDGRQYSDQESVLDDQEVSDALVRRRHAKDACHTECYFRMQCLDLAIRNGEAHGTWGGYYEEELREIRKEIARRKRTPHPQ